MEGIRIYCTLRRADADRDIVRVLSSVLGSHTVQLVVLLVGVRLLHIHSPSKSAVDQ
jgi:hypothetical protein